MTEFLLTKTKKLTAFLGRRPLYYYSVFFCWFLVPIRLVLKLRSFPLPLDTNEVTECGVVDGCNTFEQNITSIRFTIFMYIFFYHTAEYLLRLDFALLLLLLLLSNSRMPFLSLILARLIKRNIDNKGKTYDSFRWLTKTFLDGQIAHSK